ncbi:phosphoribosyltransferase [Aquisphaera insulae]|uniref:phosphoribosyltransferase n=1 Tax=Aquisphaera insulae TaxID=2712864 RepID=UPI0013EC57EF|nr:phosphoribosyltransferase [Aquisphaera insulae]
MSRPFANRAEAGRVLAEGLTAYAGRADAIVLALPRGGVPVAFEVAQALRLPLDVFLVRKLGVPDQEELAMGAVASGDVLVINDELVRSLRVPRDEVEAVILRERQELHRREQVYRAGRPSPDLKAKTVILVDDGLATGSTMRAAVRALRGLGPARIVVAVPTAAPATCEEIRLLADQCVCSITPEPFRAVGLWYDDFSQTSDEEVCDLLKRTGTT